MRRLLLFLMALHCGWAMFDQAYAVRGRLMCGSRPAANVRVKLWEEDTGPDPDDLLDSGYTNSNGEFYLGGSTGELTPIDPIFKVYHDCDDGIKPGKRKVKFGLPKSYISKGKTPNPNKVFDIGILNLETIFPKEERELIVTRRRRDYHDGRDTHHHAEHHRHHHDYDPYKRLDVIDQNDDRIISPQKTQDRNPCW